MFCLTLQLLVIERSSTKPKMSSKSSSMKTEVKEKKEGTARPAPRKPSRASRRGKKQNDKEVVKDSVEKNGAGDPVDMIFMDI